jgi:hypothetical protein
MDTDANGALIDHLDQAGWELEDWGSQHNPWVFVRAGDQRVIVHDVHGVRLI